MPNFDYSENKDYTLFGKRKLEGKLTKKAQYRAWLIYFAAFILGLLPYFLTSSIKLQVAGLGLIIPGGAYLAFGGLTAVAGIVVTWLVLSIALFLWFATGNFLAPILTWLISDLIAIFLVDQNTAIWNGAPWLAMGIVALYVLQVIIVKRLRLKKELKLQKENTDYLPQALKELKAKAVERPKNDEIELSLEVLKAQKYVMDEAFQPYGMFKGYDDIERFQTSAIRYQINHMQNTLAQIQRLYTPNFHGYASEAQRALIKAYTHRRVFDYWRLENFWGNLRFDGDPVPSTSQNIMMTGYYVMDLVLYMKNSRDMRYTEPGSVTFHLNKKKEYPHDVHTIVEQIVRSWKQSPYTIFPCEPNWIYTYCNWKAIQSVAAYDSLFNTHYIEENIDALLKKYRDEMVWPSGAQVFFKSTRLGFNMIPVDTLDVMTVPMYNVIIPRWAEEIYSVTRHNNFEMVDGKLTYILKGKGVDPGNYKTGHGMSIGSMMVCASEMGDREAVEACVNALRISTEYNVIDGGIRWASSNEGNAAILQGMINVKNGWRDTVINNLPESVFQGPVLSDVKYPDVFVAKAFSDGQDLKMVLYPGKSDGLQRITVDRMVPNGSYCVKTNQEQILQADALGQMSIVVPLEGRTPVHIVPCK